MKKKLLCFILLFVVCFALVIPKTNAFESINNERYLHTFNTFDYILLNDFILINDFETFTRDSISYTTRDTLTFNSSSGDEYRVYRNYTASNDAFSVSYREYKNQQDGLNYYINKYYFYTEQIIYDLTSFTNFTCSANFNVELSFYWHNHYYNYNINTDAFALTTIIKDLVRSDVIDEDNSIANENEFVYLDTLEIDSLSITFTNVSNKLSLGRKSNNSHTFIGVFLSEWGEIKALNPDFSSWLTSAVSGFFNFEIVDGWSFGIIFSLIVAIPIIIYLLKYFFGG